jgi:hypothetical protein
MSVDRPGGGFRIVGTHADGFRIPAFEFSDYSRDHIRATCISNSVRDFEVKAIR